VCRSQRCEELNFPIIFFKTLLCDVKFLYRKRIRSNISRAVTSSKTDNFSHHSRIVRVFRMSRFIHVIVSSVRKIRVLLRLRAFILRFRWPPIILHVRTKPPFLYSSHVYNNMRLYNTSYSVTWPWMRLWSKSCYEAEFSNKFVFTAMRLSPRVYHFVCVY
jgi:hypothetical protein